MLNGSAFYMTEQTMSNDNDLMIHSVDLMIENSGPCILKRSSLEVRLGGSRPPAGPDGLTWSNLPIACGD